LIIRAGTLPAIPHIGMRPALTLSPARLATTQPAALTEAAPSSRWQQVCAGPMTLDGIELPRLLGDRLFSLSARHRA
jgi:hypothetical protein